MHEQQPESEYAASDVPDQLDDETADLELESDEAEDDGTDALDDADSDQAAIAAAPGGDIEDLVRYVASHLVQDPDELIVESEFRGGTVYVSLRVPESEMGRVIGREGRTAKAIRTLVSIAGSRQNVHARLDIEG